jgi:uncharacterized phage protein (TIGR01671 family)
MREIKFRCWHKKGKDMSQGTSIREMMNSYQATCSIFSGPNTKEFLDNLVFMQYTGLIDKNGKEIYEGDIVRENDGSSYEIFWLGYKASFYAGNDKKRRWHSLNQLLDTELYNEYEVMGNIYQTPTLLKLIN